MDLIRKLLDIVREIIKGFMPPPLAQQIEYVTDLPENVDTLMKEARVLKSKRKDLEEKREEASRKSMRLTNQVENWLQEAANIEMEIDSIKSEFDGGSTDLMFRNQLGRRTIRILTNVKELNERGDFDPVVVRSSPARALEMPLVPIQGQSTSEEILKKIWDHLHDEHSRILCVNGMGGIGKTTLMKTTNNRLIDTHDFDIVIWVTISKDFNLGRIQICIMTNLDLHYNNDDIEDIRCTKIYDKLKDMRFLLILDDLWEEFDLDQVGIPIPNEQNRSKITITTRFVQVCNGMEADVMIKVKTLTKDEAWDLFFKKAGEVVNALHIRSIAEDMVKECNGLPLAISVVGRAMRGKMKVELWQNALRALRASAPEIPGMWPKVFLSLKLSYDHLEDDKVKICFLYCSLFPEDYCIRIHELVELWIMEGFIDNVNNLVDAYNKGHDIVERIVDACLLEEGDKSYGCQDTVKMHDLIRDMGLWITSTSSCNQGPKFMVQAGVGLKKPPREEMWRDIERISLMYNYIEELPVRPNCANLVSLFLRGNPNLNLLPSGFFELMPVLQVLDLSDTPIESLPVSISSLVNLHALILQGCEELEEVPFLGELKELQFLDLSFSGIKKLPQDMGNLVKLKMLNLSNLTGSIEIPFGVISRLSSMENLCIWRTTVNWAKESDLEEESKATLGEIATLIHLTTLKITIDDIDFPEQDAFYRRCSSLRIFRISICAHKFDDLGWFDCNRLVAVYGASCPNGVKMMLTLAEGFYWVGGNAKHVSQLLDDSKNLRYIDISHCNEMECLIDWREIKDGALLNIEELFLSSLYKLQTLFLGEVPHGNLRKLRKITFSKCHNLKSLFSSKMVEHLDRLEDLYVNSCNELEEIIEGDDKSLLCSFEPRPEDFVRSVPSYKKFVRFVRSEPSALLPSLSKINISNCPKWIPHRATE